jgi:His/Glu/Gln/Arg/opine family amino acid ABC transporter permease subunit
MNAAVVVENASQLLSGLRVTIELTLIVCGFSVAAAVPLAVARNSRNMLLAAPAVAFSWAMRSTPVLVLLYGAYYALPSAGIVLDSMPSAMICLVASGAGYNMEYFAAGFRAVNPHQRATARALGLSERRIFFRIVVPQAMPVVIPPLFSNLTNLLKGTALVSLVTVSDLTAEATSIISTTYRPLEILTVVAVAYLGLNSVLIGIQAFFERRYQIS